MNFVELVRSLREVGARLTLDDGSLRIHAPKGAIDAELQDAIRRHRDQLVESLSATGPSRDETPIRRGDRAAAPLSLAQQRVWLFQELEEGSTAYNLTVVARLRGSVDVSRLEEAIARVVRRHAPLRSVVEVGAMPRQRLLDDARVPLDSTDLSHLEGTDFERALKGAVDRQQSAAFDLAHDIPVRATLVRRSRDAFLLALTFHHLSVDGVSLQVLFRDLLTYYEGGDLEPLPVDYLDFAAWQHERWGAERGPSPDLDYWVEQLSGAPPAIAIPTDHPRGDRASYEGAVAVGSLGTAASEQLMSLAREEGASVFTVLLAAFASSLHRHSGQRDLVVGVPVNGRDRPELQELVGMFVNQLALRLSVRRGATFREVLRDAREQVMAGFSRQDVPFGVLLERLNPPRDASRAPLFQVMLNVFPGAEENRTWTGTEIEIVLPPTSELLALVDAQSKFDLTLYALEEAEGLRFVLVYNEALFEADTAARLVGDIVQILEMGGRSPDTVVGELLPAPERPGWAADAGTGASRTVPERIRELARTQPNAVALTDEAGATVTYRDLAARVESVATSVRDAAGPGEAVAVLLPHGVDAVIAVCGVLRSGRPYVPVDPGYPADRVTYMLREANVGAVLTVRALAGRARESVGQQVPLIEVEVATHRAADTAGAMPAPDDVAYLLFTSGSTGRPKAVEQTHGSLARHAQRYADLLALSPSDRVALTASLAFDASMMDLFGGLVAGAVVVPLDIRRLGVSELPELARGLGLTTLHLTPTVFRAALGTARDPRFAGVRRVDLGGEALRVHDVELFERYFPPHAVLVNSYGPSEHTLALAYPVPRGLHERATEVPIGWPVDDVEVVLLDDAGEPDRVMGEMAIVSRFNALGYRGRSDETSARFEATEDSGRTRYRTGDLVRRTLDGTYVHMGRVDHQLKVRGHRVEPGEVESVLGEHSSVLEAAVHAPIGPTGETTLTACVVGRDGASAPEVGTLSDWCRERLPDPMVPGAWVIMDALPRTPSGKVDRGALPLGALPARQGVEYVGPRTPTEEVLAEVWSEALGISSVGIRDDFFALGGHSLTAVEVVARIRDVLGVELSLREFFDGPTIAELATRPAGTGESTTLPPVERLADDVRVPLSFAQERLWVFQELDPELSTYNMAPVLELSGAVDVDRLTGAIRRTLGRHEPLRTLLVEEEGKVWQEVVSVPDNVLTFLDLSSLDEAEAQDKATAALRAEGHRPFRPAEEIPFRGLLVDLGAERHYLQLVFHHLALDANSARTFWRDMLAFYDGGTPEELPVRYRDYVAWERRAWHGDRLEQGLGFWRKHLANAPLVLDLATDRPRPPDQTFTGGRTSTEVSGPASEALSVLLREEKASAFMALLAAFAGVLAFHSRQDSVVIGAPSTGRSRTELLELVGMFANQLALHVPVNRGGTFRDLLRTARETVLAAFGHQDVPFPLLLHELNPPRDRSRTPLFQAMLTMIPPAPEELSVELAGTRFSPPKMEDIAAMGDPQARFDLTLYAQQRGGRLDVGLVYNRDLYDAERMEGLLHHVRYMVEQAAADPDRPLVEAAGVTSRDSQLLLECWNDRSGEFAPSVSALEQIAIRASTDPDRLAVDSPSGAFTYGELVDAAQRITAALIERGVRPGGRVGVIMERSREMLAVLLGIQGCGAAYVPLDPAYPPARLAYMIGHSKADVVVTHRGLERSLDAEVPILDLDRWTPPGPAGFHPTAPEDAAYVIYTSGSTGQPKGVEVPHRAVANFLAAMAEEPGLRPGDRLLAVTTISFDIAVLELFLPLVTGASVVIAGDEEIGDGRRLADRLEADDITVMQATPATWKAMLASGWAGKSDLRVLCGGETLPAALAEALVERVSELWNMYGPTETTVWSTVQRLEPGAPVLIGTPIANTSVYVLDEERRLVPVGVPGELWIGGAGVATCYVDQPDLTAERFVESPFRKGERLYRTGDLVRWRAGGCLEHLGRLDHQVKVRGFRIELGEVESRLTSHPEVRDAVAVARDDRLIAYVIPRSEEVPSSVLRPWVAEALPPYMIPSVFVPMEALPLTPNGKIDRGRLPDSSAHVRSTSVFVAPRSEEEDVLCRLWADVLAIERVGIHDDFFELGGHSLNAVEVVARAKDAFGVDLRLRRLFDHPTVAEMAEWVKESGANTDTGEIVAMEEGDI